MVNLTNEEHQRLCELAQRAEAAEARAKELEHDLEVGDWYGAFVRESERAAQMEQNWTNCVIKLAGVTHDSDEWKKLYLLRGKAIDDLIAERDELRRQLEQALEALAPLADPAQYYNGPHDTDDTMIVCYYINEKGERKGITIRDSKHAAEIIEAQL